MSEAALTIQVRDRGVELLEGDLHRSAHFDGADVDTALTGAALGPWSTSYVDRFA